ncbi:ankyrin repeat-containing domain protein [Mycena polygramma]|nr:ankyrin repeat-containing domain protein [Mycena polygramma]
MQPATANFGIGYFYFDFRDEKKQLPENMLRSIIMQLSEQSPNPYSVLNEQFKSCHGQVFPPYGDLLAMLDTILSQFTGAYIVLDALDECSEHDQLVQFISTLRGWDKPVHLLVAIVVLEPEATHADILQFVNSELDLNSKLKHMKKAKDAAPKIVDKSTGMFRMAACLLQELARKKIVTDIDKILAKLPSDLFGIYSRFLQPIDEDDFVYVASLLRWVAFSAEPITLLELEDALAIDFFEPDQCMFEPENKGRVEALWESLEGLVIVGPRTSKSRFRREKEPEVVTLAHSSVNDYIMSKKFLDEYKHNLGEAPSHTFLAQSCVAYLIHFENNPLNANTLPKYLLAQYAAQFWSHHLLRCHDRDVLKGSTMHLLEQGSPQYVALNCVYNIHYPREDPDWSQHAPSPLYLCSLIGYVEGVGFLLDHDADINAAGGEYGSALQAATMCGNADIVHILLEKGANVNAAGRMYGSALQAASAEGRMAIVRILLEHGADVNAAGGEYGYAYGSALQAAAWNGYLDIVHLLLEKGADVNAAGGRYGSALQGAAWYGSLDIVRLLLEHGAADVNTAGGEYGYGSALQAAASESYMDIVRILLEKGADVNAAGGRYGSALQGAAWYGSLDIVRLLLEHGAADVNTAGGEYGYGSALQAAASRSHMDIVRILLEHGADVNTAEGGYHSSALQVAAAAGHLGIVRILIEHGANLNATGRKYGSALQCAASTWTGLDLVHLLLENGADVNAAGGTYGSALQAAVVCGKVENVRILIEHGADVNAAGGTYGSAFRAASASGHKKVAKLLREHGALDAESSEGSESGEDSESDEDSE